LNLVIYIYIVIYNVLLVSLKRLPNESVMLLIELCKILKKIKNDFSNKIQVFAKKLAQNYFFLKNSCSTIRSNYKSHFSRNKCSIDILNAIYRSVISFLFDSEIKRKFIENVPPILLIVKMNK